MCRTGWKFQTHCSSDSAGPCASCSISILTSAPGYWSWLGLSEPHILVLSVVFSVVTVCFLAFVGAYFLCDAAEL